MALAPYLLALTFGLLISAVLHFVLVWPAREPPDDQADAGDAGPADATPARAPAPARAPRRRSSRRR